MCRCRDLYLCRRGLKLTVTGVIDETQLKSPDVRVPLRLPCVAVDSPVASWLPGLHMVDHFERLQYSCKEGKL